MNQKAGYFLTSLLNIFHSFRVQQHIFSNHQLKYRQPSHKLRTLIRSLQLQMGTKRILKLITLR